MILSSLINEIQYISGRAARAYSVTFALIRNISRHTKFQVSVGKSTYFAQALQSRQLRPVGSTAASATS